MRCVDVNRATVIECQLAEHIRANFANCFESSFYLPFPTLLVILCRTITHKHTQNTGDKSIHSKSLNASRFRWARWVVEWLPPITENKTYIHITQTNTEHGWAYKNRDGGFFWPRSLKPPTERRNPQTYWWLSQHPVFNSIINRWNVFTRAPHSHSRKPTLLCWCWCCWAVRKIAFEWWMHKRNATVFFTHSLTHTLESHTHWMG